MKEKALSAMPYLALFMLGLSASHGVYQFGLLYVNWVFALIAAAAFELTYIGLSVMAIKTDKSQNKATWVARGAMFVSVAYNVISGYLHRNPIERFDWWVEIIMAILHGAPLAVVGYLLATLVLHNTQENASSTTVTLGKKGKGKENNASSESKESETSVIIENLPKGLLPSGETSVTQKKEIAKQLAQQGYKQEQIAEVLGISRQRVGQLLKEEAVA